MSKVNKKFYGFQLLKLIQAIGNIKDPENSFCYEVEHYNVFGEKTIKTMKVKQVDRDFGKLRMSGDRYAVLEAGVSRFINSYEYQELTKRYDLGV